MRLLERQHVADPQLLKRTLEPPVLAVERIGNYCPERNAHRSRTLHQPACYLQLRAELRVVLTTYEVMRWREGIASDALAFLSIDDAS